MTSFTFVARDLWPLLLLLPAVLALGTWWSVRAERHRQRVLGPRLAGPRNRGTTIVRMGAAVAAAVAAALAVLQPAWGAGVGAPAAPDVVLCLDVSRSMAARDQAPARFAAAQRQIERLVADCLGTRLGLVVFAGDARLLVPLTADAAAVAAVTAMQAPGTAGRGGTDIGAAIDLALGTLARANSRGGSVLVLSDGEDFGGRGVVAAARARAGGVVVHCMGFGSEAGSKIVVDLPGGEQFLRDAAGDDVLTRLDARGLAAIAAAGGGGYAPAVGEHTLARLHAEQLMPRALAAAVRTGEIVPAQRFQWFLLGALACWMLRRWWPS